MTTPTTTPTATPTTAPTATPTTAPTATPTTAPTPLLTADYRSSAVFTSGAASYDTLAAVATRLAILAVEDTLNDPCEERTTERITLVEHLMRFANAHGSTRPAAAVRQALASMLYANGRPGTPVLSILEELQIATSHTQ